MAQTVSVLLSSADRLQLDGIVGDRGHAHKHGLRARIILLSAEHLPVLEIANRVGVSRPMVWRWQQRFAEEGVERPAARQDSPARHPPVPQAKVHDVATMTHDYKRNGTTTLFAALNVLEGKVLGRCVPRHRHQEFVSFLSSVERIVPAGKMIHAILDNYATHKHPVVRDWLAEHPRWTFHFTPTSCSWLNAVEGFFSKLTRQSLRRGIFHSVDDLQKTIARYIADTNKDPKPFIWTATAKSIKAKLGLEPSV